MSNDKKDNKKPESKPVKPVRPANTVERSLNTGNQQNKKKK